MLVCDLAVERSFRLCITGGQVDAIEVEGPRWPAKPELACAAGDDALKLGRTRQVHFAAEALGDEDADAWRGRSAVKMKEPVARRRLPRQHVARGRIQLLEEDEVGAGA